MWKHSLALLLRKINEIPALIRSFCHMKMRTKSSIILYLKFHTLHPRVNRREAALDAHGKVQPRTIIMILL